MRLFYLSQIMQSHQSIPDPRQKEWNLMKVHNKILTFHKIAVHIHLKYNTIHIALGCGFEPHRHH